ncbi:MAG: CDGSH iron-sulfur domain-containing protein [Luteitalea sp.]|nr:CDGSH iron-sulfur domain-containing protein [Luteitalea sp.]
MTVTIKVRQNGPYLVDGEDIKVVDWNGHEYPITKTPFALCRCGHSNKRPFCDGSHRACAFEASEAAPLPAESTLRVTE